MSALEVSSQQLRAGASNTEIIEQAIGAHPVNQLTVGDVGHAGVAAALNQFRQAWTGEFGLRRLGATQAGQVLTAAAADTERLDALLALSASRIGSRR